MCLTVYVRMSISKIVKSLWEFSLSKFCFIIKHFQAGVKKINKILIIKDCAMVSYLTNILFVSDFRSKECGVGKRTCRGLLWIDFIIVFLTIVHYLRRIKVNVTVWSAVYRSQSQHNLPAAEV